MKDKLPKKCKGCEKLYYYTAENKASYAWCSLFDKSVWKVVEDLKFLLYDWGVLDKVPLEKNNGVRKRC